MDDVDVLGLRYCDEDAMFILQMHSENSNGNGVLYTGLYVGLICVGNVVKWVVCVVSYHACRTRVSEKKDDEDQNLRLLLHRNCI